MSFHSGHSPHLALKFIEELVLSTFSIFISPQCYAQEQKYSPKISVIQQALGEGIKLISRSDSDSVLVENSTDRFLPYEGMIICVKNYSLFKTSVSELAELSRSIRFAAKSKAREKTSKVTLRSLHNLCFLGG